MTQTPESTDTDLVDPDDADAPARRRRRRPGRVLLAALLVAGVVAFLVVRLDDEPRTARPQPTPSACDDDGPCVRSGTGLLSAGEPQVLTVDGLSGDTLGWNAVDLDGARVDQGRVEVSGGTATVEVAAQPVGYYEVRLDTSADPLVFSYGVIGDEPARDDFFGAQTHYHFGQDRYDPRTTPAMLRSLGVSITRDGATWSDIEPEPGRYTEPEDVTAYLAGNESAGMDTYWLANGRNDTYDDGEPPTTQPARRAFALYVDQHLSRHPELRTVEVWNEWNGHQRTRPKSPEQYAALLCTVQRVVERSHPDVEIVGGATSGFPIEWFEQFAAAGGMECADALSFHPYRHDTATLLQKVSQLKTLMDDTIGRQLPLIASELGWSTTISGSERTSADRLVAQTVALRAAGVRTVSWYEAIDQGPGIRPAIDPTSDVDLDGTSFTPQTSGTTYAAQRLDDSVRFELRPDEKTSTLTTDATVRPGDEYWTSFDLRTEISPTTSDAGAATLLSLGSGDAEPAAAINLVGTSLELVTGSDVTSVRAGARSGAADAQTLGETTAEQPARVVMRVAAGDDSSRITLWVNGEQVAESDAPLTGLDTNALRLSLGLQRNAARGTLAMAFEGIQASTKPQSDREAKADPEGTIPWEQITTRESNFGMFYRPTGAAETWRPKIAGVAYWQMASQLAGSEVQERVDLSDQDPEAYAYRFTRGDADVTVAWRGASSQTFYAADVDDTRTLRIPVDPDRTTVVTDVVGREIDRSEGSDTVEVAVGPSPVYVTQS